MGRAPCCDKEKVRKGAWSPEEDAKLKHYIQSHGSAGNWIALPHKAGLRRCGKSCRLRWLNYLRPNIKHGEFSHEEDTIISTLFASIGSRWSIMATQLPGRTDNDIKNYWNTKLKKKLMLGMAAGNYSTTPPSIASSLDLQSISSSPTNYFMAAQESFSSPMMQNYHSVHGGNMVMFGGEVSSNSSEGSQIEHQHLNTYNFYQGSSADDQVQANHEDGLVMWGSSETEADLEEIKQLISSPNSSNIMFDDSPLGLV